MLDTYTVYTMIVKDNTVNDLALHRTRDCLFYSTDSFSLSNPDAYITHNATPTTNSGVLCQ